MPVPKRPSPDDMYPCGYLNKIIVGDDGHIKTSKLLEMLQSDSDLDGAAQAVVALDGLQFVTYTDYELMPRTVTEIVFKAPPKQVVALYTAPVGGGDQSGRLVSASLPGLAELLKECGADVAHEFCLKLHSVLDIL